VTQDNIIKLSQPGTFSDPLTEVLRNGARALLAQAVEAEVAGFLGGYADKLTDDHGQSGIGASSRENIAHGRR
jgi:putative transposase